MPPLPTKRIADAPRADGKLDAAMRLHDAGFWVVPQVGKRAVVLGWDRWRLSDDDLRDYFSRGSLNLAIALSQTDPGLMDVECDGEEAEQELQRLMPSGVPDTPTWRSRRGLHRLFLRPDGLPDRAKVEVRGIEFRIGNKPALSTVPPSVHPDDGTIYEWLPGLSPWDVDAAPLPESLHRLLRKAPKKVARDPQDEGYAFEEGERRDALNRFGYRLVRQDSSISRDALLGALKGENESHCRPPLSDAEVESLAADLMGAAERSTRDVISMPCGSWADVVAAWQDACEWRGDMAYVLQVMLAVCASTSQTGDQLFLQVIGEPSSFKTKFCDALLTSTKCKLFEKLTGFFSGVYDPKNPERDFSFIARANHCTLITPEADTMMASPNFHQVMSEQRRIFDGSASATWKNRDFDLKYPGLRTPWIMAGTQAMLDRDQSHVGDRFLRCFMSPPDEDAKRRIMRRVGRTALDAVCIESNCQPESILVPEVRRAYQLTGGYVDWLRANVTNRVRGVVARSNHAEVEEHCHRLADFTAAMRSRPPVKTGFADPDYQAVKELPFRLHHQFVRLAAMTAVVLNKPSIDAECLAVVRRVALDTSFGRTRTLTRELAAVGRRGAVPSELAIKTRDTDDRVERWLRHMERVKVVIGERPKSDVTQPLRWRLTDRMETLHREVVQRAQDA